MVRIKRGMHRILGKSKAQGTRNKRAGEQVKGSGSQISSYPVLLYSYNDHVTPEPGTHTHTHTQTHTHTHSHTHTLTYTHTHTHTRAHEVVYSLHASRN